MNQTSLPISNKVKQFFIYFGQALKGEQQDYTTGSIRKAVFMLAIPMIFEMLMESVFALVDIYFVNKLGAHATSTVGLTESVITIVYSVAIGLSAAATATVARRIGEKNPEAAAHAAMQAILLSLIVTVFISIFGAIYASDILKLMGAEPQTVAIGTSYTQLTFASSAVIILLFLINGIFRGAGDASIAMKSLWIANICNIILCPTLINGFGPIPAMGLFGAALATTIGRGVGVIYQIYYLFNAKGAFQIHLRQLIPNFPLLRSLINIAYPATGQFVIASASWIFLAAMVAQSGSNASAGYQTALRIVMFFILPAWGLSNAAATLVGQNLGANRPERAEQSVLKTAQYNAVFMAFATVFFIFGGKFIVSFFVPAHETEQIKYAIEAMQLLSLGYVFYGVGMVMSQAFNGAGDTSTPTIVSFIGFWLFQIPLAYCLVHVFQLGAYGVFIAVPVAETAIAIANYLLFRQGKWKKVKI